jgi:hypothetical protein
LIKRDEGDFGEDPPTTMMPQEQLKQLAARTRGEFPKLSEAEAFSDDPTAIAKLSAAEILAAAGEAVPAAPRHVSWRPWQDSTVLLIACVLVTLLAVLAVHD